MRRFAHHLLLNIAVVVGTTTAIVACDSDPGDGGVDATDSTDGTDGTDTSDGTDTTDGSEGTDGTDSTDGADPALSCQVRLSSGNKDFGPPDVLSLSEADEPASYQASAGFQVDFRAITRDVPSGSSIRLMVNGSAVRTLEVNTMPDGAGQVGFANVTLPVSGARIWMETAIGGQAIQCNETQFSIDTTRCDVTLSPSAGACLTDNQSIAGDTAVELTVANPDGRCDQAYLIYTVAGNEVITEPVALALGQATIPVNIDGLANGLPIQVRAVVQSTESAARENETEGASYTVDVAAPAPTILSPSAGSIVGLGLDVDQDPANGLQLAVSGEVTGVLPADGQSITVTTSDGQTVQVAPSGATAPYKWKAELSFPGDAQGVWIKAAAQDACGNVGEVEVQNLTIAVNQAALALIQPPDGSVLWAVDDQDPATPLTYETDLTVEATGLTFPTTLTVRCGEDVPEGAPKAAVGSLEVSEASADGLYAVPVAINAALETAWLCEVTDDGVNPAVSAEVGYVVALPAPQVVVQAPADGTLTNATALVLSGGAVNLDGRTGTVTATGPEGPIWTVDVPAVVDGGFAWTVYLTATGTAGGAPLADGTYSLELAISDVFGNPACPQAGSQCAVDVVVDRTPPVLAITQPATPSIDPDVVADTSATMPGYQTAVTVSVSGGGSVAGTEVCITLGGAGKQCQTLAEGEASVTFGTVTLQPGDNTIQATATDAADNAAVPVQQGVNLISEAPVVVVTSPAQDTSTVIPQVDVTIQVNDLDGSPENAADVVVLVDGQPVALNHELPVTGGAYVFQNVPLGGLGVHTVAGQASVNGGPEGVSASVNVKVKEAPTVAITSLTNNQVLNATSPVCALGQTGCKLPVTCTTTDADDGSAATLSYSCGAGLQTVNSTVEDEQAIFTDVVLANNATCTVSCEITDAGTGLVATSSTVSVKVDRTVPKIGPFVKPLNNSLIYVDDESSGTPGFQYSVQVRVAGVEAGQIVTLKAAVQGGATTTQTKPVPTSVPDNQPATIFFSQQTYQQGVVTFTATVSDAAGNAAAAATKTVQIVSEQPLIRISQPEFTSGACTNDEDCGSIGLCIPGPTGNTCGLGWGLNSDTTLLIKTQNIPTLAPNQIRVCSDNPEFIGQPTCGASGDGYHQAVVVNVTGDTHVIDIGSAADGIHNFVVEAKLNDAGTLWVSSTGASTIEDQFRTVLIDTDAPSISDFGSPNDTVAPTGCLNFAEGDGNYDITATCSQDGTVELFLGAQTVGTLAAEAGQDVTFPGVELPAAEGLVLTAVCTDAVGNSSNIATLTVDVDVTAPTLGFDKPSTTPLLAGANLDVELVSDEINGFVSLNDSQQGAIGSEIVDVDGFARFPHDEYGTLSEGAHTLTATVSDACGNTETAEVQVTVDTVPPAVAVLAPANGATFTDADDASPAGGFQVSVNVDVSGDANGWELALETDCASDFTGCSAAAIVASGDLAPGAEVPTQMVTLPIFKTPDYLRMTATVTDAAGNVVTSTVEFTVTLSNCQLSFQGLPTNGQFGNAQCATPGVDCASVEKAFTVQLVGACGSIDSVNLLRGGQVVATAPVADSATSFTQTFAHNTSVTLEAQGDAVSSGEKTWSVDLADPAPKFTATTIAGFQTPGSGANVSWNSQSDQSPTAGLQVHLRVDVTDNGQGGGQITKIEVVSGGTATAVVTSPATPITVVGTTFGVDLMNVTLPDGDAQTVRVTSKDKVGNEAISEFTYSSDIVKPSPLTLALTVDNTRKPAVTLDWSAVADNAAAGAPATAYDIRYSRQPITTGTWAQACQANTIANAAPLPTPAAPGQAQTYSLTGPDQRAMTSPCQFIMRTTANAPYYFAARVQDDAGNWSDLGAGSVVSTTELTLQYAKFSVTGPLTDDDFDKRISPIGDVNNDGFADFAVGGNTSFGICIFYGSANAVVPDLSINPNPGGGVEEGPNWQCLLDKDQFGNLAEHRAGHISKAIGDVNADGLQDFAVPAGRSGSSFPPQQVRIYFGVDGGKVSYSPSVVITNYAPLESTTTSRWDGGGNFNGDFHDHDGNAATPPIPVTDIVVGSRRQVCSPTCDGGRAFVIPGNPNWTPGTVIDLSKAADLQTHNVVKFHMPNPPDGIDPRFGAQVEFTGDILPDLGASYDDIMVAQDDPTENTRALILRGRPVSGYAEYAISFAHDGSEPEDLISTELMPDDGKNNFAAGSNILRQDVNGDGIPEVILAHTKNDVTFKMLFVFDGQAIRDAEGDTLMMGIPINPNDTIAQQPVGNSIYVSPVGAGSVWVGNYSDLSSVGNIADQNVPGVDTIGIAYRNLNDPGRAYIRLNTNTASLPYGTYPYVDLSFRDPFNPDNALFAGRDIVGIGDFNGDGLQDFVIGTDGSGYAVLAY